MENTSFFKKNEKIYTAELDNEICLFNSEIAEYLTFNESASIIWKSIGKTIL